MKAKEFITEKLKELFELFENIQIRYEYRNSTNSHIIEIKPKSLFEEDEAYMEMEADLEKEFEQLFPSENIVFISEGSITEIKDAVFELKHFNTILNNVVSDFELSEFGTFNFIFDLKEKNEPVEAGENNYALAA